MVHGPVWVVPSTHGGVSGFLEARRLDIQVQRPGGPDIQGYRASRTRIQGYRGSGTRYRVKRPGGPEIQGKEARRTRDTGTEASTRDTGTEASTRDTGTVQRPVPEIQVQYRGQYSTEASISGKTSLNVVKLVYFEVKLLDLEVKLVYFEVKLLDLEVKLV